VTFVQPAPVAVAASPGPVFQPPPAAPVVAAPVPTPVGSVGTTITDDEAIELYEDFEDEELAPLSAGGSAHGTVRTPRSAPVSPAVGPVYVNGASQSARPAATRAAVSTPARTMVTESTAPRPRRPVSETAQLADAIEAMQPGIGEDELAARLGITASRLRQVRREAEAKRASLRA